MKKLRGTILIVIITTLLLTGCIGGDTYQLPEEREEGSKVELSLWGSYNDEEYILLEEVIAMFEAENPDITVRVERVPYGNIWGRITTGLALNETPDIARVDMEHVAILADRKATVDMHLLGVDEIAHEYIDGSIGSSTLGGKVWGVPDSLDTKILVYNKKLFDEADLDYPHNNWSWDDLVTAGKEITNQKDIFGFAIDDSLMGILPYYAGFGTNLLSDDGTKLNLNSPEAVDALQLKVDLVHKHGIAPGPWEEDAMEPLEGFNKGKYGMIMADSKQLEEITEIDFGVALLPNGPAGPISTIDGTNLVVFRNSQHPREAYQFIKFLTSAEVQSFWSQDLAQIPVNKAAVNEVDTSENPQLKAFIEQSQNISQRPMLINQARFEEVIIREIHSALALQKTPTEALEDAKEDLEGEKGILYKK